MHTIANKNLNIDTTHKKHEKEKNMIKQEGGLINFGNLKDA